jgi:Zn-finger nucleic acid-binding protein
VFGCAHCGTEEPIPAALSAFELGEGAGADCPACHAALLGASVAGWPTSVCPSCFGVLAGMASFVAVVEAVRLLDGPPVDALPPRRQRPGDRVLLCPRCHDPMLSHQYGGAGNVVIDSCESCQVNWLDGGELRRIALAPRTPTRR